MKKTFSICVMLCAFFIAGCKSSNEPENQNQTTENQEYVDLGLPSGTLWKNENELNPKDSCGLYNFGEALDAFDKNLPTLEQCEELINMCSWLWTGSGCTIIGPNDNHITMPAWGCVDGKNQSHDMGEAGFYWSRTYCEGRNKAYQIIFSKSGPVIDDLETEHRFSVRLVKSK